MRSRTTTKRAVAAPSAPLPPHLAHAFPGLPSPYLPSASSSRYQDDWSAEERQIRRGVARRLARYASGELHSIADPHFYRERPWSERTHRFSPPIFRQAVWLLLLHANRLQARNGR